MVLTVDMQKSIVRVCAPEPVVLLANGLVGDGGGTSMCGQGGINCPEQRLCSDVGSGRECRCECGGGRNYLCPVTERIEGYLFEVGFVQPQPVRWCARPGTSCDIQRVYATNQYSRTQTTLSR